MNSWTSGVTDEITAARAQLAPDAGEMKKNAANWKSPADPRIQVQPDAGPASERTIGVCLHFRLSI
jgi:hypothetical protein